jgi:hypothetical protein
MAKPDLTADILRAALHYDPQTGIFSRISVGRGKRPKDGLAGCINKNGYRVISVLSVQWYAHRLAWLHVRGTWPAKEVDHIDGNRSNNAIANLRDVDGATNCQNLRRAHSGNTSGYLGVSWRSRDKIWYAQIWDGTKQTNLGRFETPELASAAYLDAKRKLHQGCTI